MDKRSWPWKKKTSEKAAIERALSAATDSTTSRVDAADYQADQDKVEVYKKPKCVQISMDSYSHFMGLEDQVKSYEEKVKNLEEEVKDLMGLEDQVKFYEEQVKTLEEEVNELNEKLSTANTEMIKKDNMVKQHAKVAEDAVSGWEKAETEAAALKTRLESVTTEAQRLRLTSNSALNECVRQIRDLKEENEQKLQELAIVKINQFDRMKIDFESKIADLDQELRRSSAENAILSRSLQERSNTVVKLSGENSQAEANIELLRNNIKLSEKEINSLRYELHVVEKELEIRNEEKNMSARSAEVANKQHLEGLKKIAKLEVECQRLRGLVKKKLPGPAALAQMKLEVENLDRECGETRLTRSPVKSSSPHMSAFSDLSFDGIQKYQKENELLTGRLLAMEEETKMLKEALAKRNSELQISRSTCAKTTNKLKSLEAQLLSVEHNCPREPQYDSMLSRDGSNPPSLNSLSEDGNGDGASCPGSWATTSVSELSHIKRGKSIASPRKVENASHLELMDDFAEMEKLAYGANGAIFGSDIPNNLETGNAGGNYVEINSKEEVESKYTHDQTPSEKLQVEVLTLDARPNANQPPLMMIQSTISLILESMPDTPDKLHLLRDVLHTLKDMHDSLGNQSSSSTTAPSPKLHTVHNNITNTGNADTVEEKNPSNSVCKPYPEFFNSIPHEVETAISQIHDFVMFLGKETKSVQTTCSDREGTNLKLASFSASYNAVMDGRMNLMDFVLDLSLVLTSVNEFHMLDYKHPEVDLSSSEYIDKAALPENNDITDLSYPDGCPNFSDSLPEPYLPHEENPVPTSEPKSTVWICSLEEFERLKQEKDDMLVDLSRCIEDLECKKSQLQETEQLLAEVKSQLTAAQKMNSLTETQLKCMAESYKLLETRAEELQKEVNVLRDGMETRTTELQVERKNYQDALVKCKVLEEQMMRFDRDSVFIILVAGDLAMAAEKLGKCRETIFLLLKQLNALFPQTKLIRTLSSESSQKGRRSRHQSSSLNFQKSSSLNFQNVDPGSTGDMLRWWRIPRDPGSAS